MRPRRVYKNQKGRYYYLIKGKKKFIKTPAGISDKKVININIKNVQPVESKRIKRRKKRRLLKYEKDVTKDMKKYERATSGTITAPLLPVYLFEPNKNIESIITASQRKSDEKKKDEDITKLKEEILLLKNEPHNIKGKVETEEKKTKKKEEPKGEEETKGTEKETDETYDEKLISIINNFLKNYDGFSKDERFVKDDFKEYINTNYKDTVFEKDINSLNTNEQRYINKKLMEFFPSFKDLKGAVNKEVQIKENLPSIVKKFLTDNKEKFIGKKIETVRKAFTTYLKSNYSYLYSNEGVLKTLTANIFKEQYEKIIKGESVGSGKSDTKSHALWNTEIEQILKKTIKPDFVPVVASDELDNLFKYVYEGMPDFSFIMNTAKSTSDGSTDGHWVSCYIDNNDDYKSIEYYDPLAGGRPSPTLIACLRKIAKIINPEYTFLYKQNNLKQQADTTDTCGYFAIRFLELRNNHVPFSVATGYDDYIDKIKPDESIEGEGKLKSTVKKYNSYI